MPLLVVHPSDLAIQLKGDGKLQNSDVLQNVEGKLSHLPWEEKKAVMGLMDDFVVLFPGVPGKTNCGFVTSKT